MASFTRVPRAIGIATLLSAAWAVPAQADVSGPAIVGYINAQRAAQGIPAGIVEDPVLSAGCAKHNHYGKLNDVLTHGENALLPGYTAAGDEAGQTSVLYSGGGPWSASRNPFEMAPIHLHQLLAPRLDRMGASENEGYGCATTLASRNRPAPPADTTYTYPGDGAQGWPAAQVAAEGPYTPGERVGIPAGTQTGPYLYVMFDGPELSPFASATSTSATLAGPDGAVAIAVVDNETPGLEGYLPAGMEVIPRAPLRALTTYTASVTASVTTGGGLPRAFAKSWSFQTGAASSARPYTVKVPKHVRHGRRIKVSIGAIADFSLRLRLSSPGGRTLLSNPKRTLAGGGVTWIYRLSVRRPYSRKGRKVRVTLVIGVDGKRYTERRTVKFT